MAVPEFPVALIVLVIAITSLVAFYRIKPIKT
ncbi:MAG: PEFG-CTERM sorting domain-containing protein [Thaumarchaeota archaeon]|nr:MAG: PEFG-CTERM sorting domain-containing protein [Nitrososphaerota archaeon]